MPKTGRWNDGKEGRSKKRNLKKGGRAIRQHPRKDSKRTFRRGKGREEAGEKNL